MIQRTDRAALKAACVAAEKGYRTLEDRFNRTQDPALVDPLLRLLGKWRACQARLDAVPDPTRRDPVLHDREVALSCHN